MRKFLQGLTILLLLIFCTTTSVFAQEPCDEEGNQFPLPGLNCDSAPVLCALDAINGYCAIMPPPPAPPGQPSPLCGDQTVVNNIIWFGFVASAETVNIEALIEDCSVNGNGTTGVQYGIYSDCSFTNAVECAGNSNVGMVTLGNGVVFEPGQTYFVFFDGFGGSVCTISIDITQGGGLYEVADPTGIDNTFNPNFYDPPLLANQVCQGGEIDFFAEGIPSDNTEDYWWTIDPATSDYPTGIITIADDAAPVNDVFQVILDLSDAGTYEICAYAYTGCDTSVVECQIIEVVPLPLEELDVWEVCENDFPTAGPPEWEGGILNGPGDYNVDLEDAAFSCDYSQTLTVEAIPLMPEEIVTLAVCDFDFTQQFDICNQVVFGDQTNAFIVCPDADANGCDSMIILTIDFINVIGNLDEPVCEGGMLNFSWAGAYPQSDNFTVVTFNLYRDNFLVFSADGASFNPNVDVMPVPIEGGTYYLEVVVEKFGTECVFSSNLETVDVDDLLPNAPSIGAWALNPCILDSVTYQLGANADPTLDYVWEVTPSGGLVIADNNSTSIGINWQGATAGQTYTICVTADNGCGFSDPVCDDVQVLAQPVAGYTAPDVICITDVANIQYNGSSITGGTYTWNFGGGDVGGANTNSAGPFNVSYATPGVKIVTLRVNQGACISEIFTDSIEVVVPLDPPLINCASETDSIGFSWNNLAEDYNITVIGAPGTAVFNETDSSFSVTNLVPNDVVIIEVTAVDSGPCGDVTTTTECIAQNCPPISIDLEVPATTICLDASAVSLDLGADVDPILPGAIGTWSGNGIVDVDQGIFDPSSAGVGMHTVVYTYENDCSYSESVVITVVEQPVSSFELEDAICITDVVTVNYTGTFSGGGFTWDFDGGNATGNNAGPFDISWSTPGIKTITAVVANGLCESEVFSQTVDVQDTLSTPILTCNPETTEILFNWNNVDNATEYEIFINSESQGTQTGTTYTQDGLVPGNVVSITVVAISDNLCPSSSSFTSCEALNCPNTIVNLTTPQNTVCLDVNSTTVQIDSEIIGGEDEPTLTWSGNGINQVGLFDPTVAGVGVHDIVLEYNVLNCFEYDTIVMTVLASPIASFTTQESICVTDTFIVDFDGQFVTSPTFSWTLNGGNISGDAPGPYKVWFNSAGTFDISLQLTEAGCQSSVFTETVEVEDELILPAPEFECLATTNSIFFSWPDVDCATEYVVFVNSVEQATQSATEFFVSNLDSDQNVNFEIIAISECACGDASFSTTCSTINCPPISLEITDIEDICLENNTTSIQLAVTENGSSGNEESTWIGNGMDQNGLFDPLAAGAGVHQIIYTLSDANCLYQDNITIVVNESPTAEINFTDPSCPGEEDGTIEILADGGDGNYSVFVNNEQIETGSVAELPGNNYTIEVIDGNGCMYSEVVSLITPQIQDININGLTTIISGDTSTYSISNSIPSEDITDIVWLDAAGNVVCAGVDCEQIEYTTLENDTLCATITYGEGCVTQDCISIRSEKVRLIYIPNTFTPNDDGVNDFWTISPNDEIEEIPLVQIFNRWGEKMFESTDVPTDGSGPNWDGRFKGQSLNPGVYVYLINVIYSDGTPEVISGDLTIIN